MSATGRNKDGRERLLHDQYETPDWCVHRLLDAVGHKLPGASWLEPGSGSGAIVSAVGSHRPPQSALPKSIRWTAVEKRRECRPALCEAVRRDGDGEVVIGDFLSWAPVPNDDRPGKRPFDVALGNPPFSLAQEFVERAVQLADVVIMLLRLNFLEGERRAELLRRMTPSIYVLPNRPSFTGGGTDATGYAWFAWGLDPEPRVCILDSTPKAVRCARLS